MVGSVLVKLKTTNDYGDSKDTLDKEYSGEARLLAKKQIVRYKDDGVTCTVRLLDEQVIIMRKAGEATSTLTLERGKLHSTAYATAYGNMELSVYTEKLIVKRTEDTICIEARYRASLSGQEVSVNDMHMVVRLTEAV